MPRICTFNVRGLSSSEKRNDVLNWLKSENYDVFLLQETHCSKELEKEWRMQWGGKCILSTFSASARGVAILFKKNVDVDIRNTTIDPEGRFILSEIDFEEKQLLLGNIYGPNEDSPIFFENIKSELTNLDTTSVILGGDWNTCSNFQLDTYNHAQDKHKKAREKIVELKECFHLEDVYRIHHPNEKLFTWRSKNPVRMSRLDYFLISSENLNLTNACSIKHGYRSDHSIAFLDLSFSQNPKGSGYWKFNCSLLHDKEYVDKVKNTIKETVDQYCTGRVDNVPTFNISHRMLWEMLKLSVRGITIKYSAEKKRSRKNEETAISKQIEELEKRNDSQSVELRETLLSRLQSIRKEKLAGTVLRSRARWIDEGEVNSKYFCGLEKRNFVRKTISKVVEKGNTFSDNGSILEAMKDFYKDLYSEKSNANVADKKLLAKFLQPRDVKLSEEEKDFCENVISKEECLSALKEMQNGKSPGIDGFSAEFYKFFWSDISEYLYNSFKEAFVEGELSITQKEGLITCTPKSGKDTTSLKNWRPITLLNIDYKILSAAIAKRFKKVLPSIISDTQKGFLKGRFIGENTRLLYDVLFETEKRKMPGLLLLVDFKKAFDSLRWSYMHDVLRHYGFGDNMKNWIKVLYTNITSRIINNGYISETFNLERGVRQGDPLSPYLFILAAEPLATSIKNNPEIKGININGFNSIISQFADDTAFTLDGTEKSLLNTLLTLRDFGKLSGLEMNNDKTKAIWFGSKKKCKMKLCSSWNLDWTGENFRFLGIIFDLETNNIPKLNFEKAKSEIENIFKRWEYRNLTLYGKITIIKTFALSKINHVLSAIPEPKDFTKKLQKIFNDFLWNGKRNTIKHTTLILDYSKGGLKMVDLPSFTKAIRLAWVKRLLTSSGQWQNLTNEILNRFSKSIFFLNNNSITKLNKTIQNPFWKQILIDWVSLQNKPDHLVIWNNEDLKINGKSIAYKSFIDNNIIFIEDLLSPGKEFYTYEQLQSKFPQLKTNFIQYQGLIKAIPKEWKNAYTVTNSSILNKLLKNEKPSKIIYQSLIEKIGSSAHSSKQKWEQILSANLNWEKIYSKPQFTTKDKKLKLLQYKISHRRVATNEFLDKIKIKNNANCTFCKSNIETIEHLFYQCQYSKNILNFIKNKINQNTQITFPEEMESILLGEKIENVGLNYILLCYKYFIYRCKYQEANPNIKHFQSFLNDKITIEKQSYIQSGKINKFREVWLEIDHKVFLL